MKTSPPLSPEDEAVVGLAVKVARRAEHLELFLLLRQRGVAGLSIYAESGEGLHDVQWVAVVMETGIPYDTSIRSGRLSRANEYHALREGIKNPDDLHREEMSVKDLIVLVGRDAYLAHYGRSQPEDSFVERDVTLLLSDIPRSPSPAEIARLQARAEMGIPYGRMVYTADCQMAYTADDTLEYTASPGLRR